MSLFNQIKNEAKMDSRRFGKSVVCRIIYGEPLAFLYANNLIPIGVFIDKKTGLDPINNYMVVVPVYSYNSILNYITNFDTQVKDPEADIEDYFKISQSKQSTISAIQQLILLVTLNQGSIPEGFKGGANPEAYDVMIDSIDVNQAIEATYVYRNVNNLREVNLKWDRQ